MHSSALAARIREQRSAPRLLAILRNARNGELVKHVGGFAEIARKYHGARVALLREFAHHVGPLGEQEQLVRFVRGNT